MRGKTKIKRLIFLLILGAIGLRAQNVSEVAALIKYGQLDSARTLAARWTPADSLSDSQLFLKALAQKNARIAAGLYETLLIRHPVSDYADDALFRLAQGQYAEGLYSQSRSKLHRLLQTYPRSPLVQKVLLWMGMTFQATGQNDSARVYYDLSVAENPLSEIADMAGTAAAENPISTEAPPRLTPSSAQNRYSVQVGAFSNVNSANMRKAFFENEGFEVKLRTKNKDGTQLYLIWVGSFATPDEARVFGSRLKKRYGSGYVLVRE